MARPRVYRHQVAAPNAAPTGCPKTDIPKAARSITAAIAVAATFPKPLVIAPAPPTRSALWAMYREGSSLSAIGRIFGVSAQAVTLRLKKGGAPRGLGCGGGANSATPVLPAFSRRR